MAIRRSARPAAALGCAAALLAAAELSSCGQAASAAARPGEPGYVPPGWTPPAPGADEASGRPARVVAFRQAPGLHARNPAFSLSGNASKLLDYPDGGGSLAPNNDSLVSLGMAGGWVVLEFDPPLADRPGADFIVFGNAYYQGGDRSRVWQEPGTVWVSRDENGNGAADDAWHLLLPAWKATEADPWTTPREAGLDLKTVIYKKADFVSAGRSSWWPREADGDDELRFEGVLVLPAELYSAPGRPTPLTRALADCSPVLVRGDLGGLGPAPSPDDDGNDGVDDYPSIPPLFFYGYADRPGDRGIDPGSGGGDAMDLAWAVDPGAGWAPVELDGVRWVKIVSASSSTGDVGDYSCEVDSLVRAVAP